MEQYKSTAKDVFSHLLAIVTLYVAVVSSISLLFQYINFQFPDQLNFSILGITEIIRTSVSAIVIVWPVYLFMSWLIAKDEAAHPDKREIWVRKWLLYFTLFIAAITMIIDLVVLVFNFLGGEISIRFFLKVVAVLAVVGSVFAFYLWDIRRTLVPGDKKRQLYGYISTALLAITAIAGFFIIGSPTKQRQIRFDEQRVSHLQQIQSQVVYYWQTKQSLPNDLTQLNDNVNGFTVPTDPENYSSYEYNVKEKTTFELCTTFTQKSLVNAVPQASTKPVGIDELANSSWIHDAGHVCFSRTIDPDKYPPIDSQKVPAVPL
ncbi:hypothetical protein HGA91_05205 [candidate division WWE3 bacterium]|nr:hypothetical protein [candidate division WWE3 bacterium]